MQAAKSQANLRFRRVLPKIVNEYDQEIPQSQTADNPGMQRKLGQYSILQHSKLGCFYSKHILKHLKTWYDFDRPATSLILYFFNK